MFFWEMLPEFHPKIFAQQGKSRAEGIPDFFFGMRIRTLCGSLYQIDTYHSKLCGQPVCRIMKHAGGEYVDLGEGGEGDEGVEGEGGEGGEGEGDAELEAEKLSLSRLHLGVVGMVDDVEILWATRG